LNARIALLACASNLDIFVNGTDPTGRYDEYDDLMADLQGHKVATLGYIVEGASVAAGMTEGFVGIAGSLLGLDLIDSFKNIYEGNGGFWDYVDAGLTLAPGLGAAGKVALKAGRKAFGWGRKYNKLRKQRSLLRANRLRGLAFEGDVLSILGMTKNTKRVQFDGVTAIPDALTPDSVIEIKDALRISLSPQLKAMGKWAEANGKKAILYVSDRNEYVSGPVHRLFVVLPAP
jgi:hypothetical protein